MSLQPLRIGPGRRLAVTVATYTYLGPTLIGFMLPVSLPALTEPGGQALSITMVALYVVFLGVPTVAGGQILIRLALGPFRTAGSIAHYTRNQVAAFGVGLAVGTAMTPFLHTMDTLWIIVDVALAGVILTLSLLLVSVSRRQPLEEPAPAGISLVVGEVDDQKWPVQVPRVTQKHITTISYPDQQGTTRYVRHLRQQGFIAHGVMGQVQVNEQRPDQPRFIPPRRTPEQMQLSRDAESRREEEITQRRQGN